MKSPVQYRFYPQRAGQKQHRSKQEQRYRAKHAIVHVINVPAGL
jgi:hypothetical protein